MNLTTRWLRRSTMLVVCAGAANLVIASGQPPSKDRVSTNINTNTNANEGEFCHASKLLKKDVVNPNGEAIGSIQDAIFDRGEGDIEYLLVRSGDVLGIGGKTIAVPLSSFERHQAADAKDKDRKNQLVLRMTPEQIKHAAEFVPANWTELRHTSWADDLDYSFRDRKREDVDPTAAAIAAATEESIGGEVIAVRRESWEGSSDEYVTAVVRANDGKTRDVVFGPSWYVMSQETVPMRGDKIDARVRTITKDGSNPTYYVTSATIDGKHVVVRNDTGQGNWWRRDGQPGDPNRSDPYPISIPPTSDSKVDPRTDPNRPNDPNRTNERDTVRDPNRNDGRNTDSRLGSSKSHQGRLMLMSDLIGAKTHALDKEGGEIDDAIVESRSGRIIFLCLDPNENALGIGDTTRCIPWPVANIGPNGTVRLDVSQQMLTSAQEMPKDPETFYNAQTVNSAYAAFDVRPPRFESDYR